MNRKIIWGVPIGMVILGLLIVLFSHIQPSVPATVLSVAEQTYTPARKLARGSAKAVYHEVMEVSYGEGKTAQIRFSHTDRRRLPAEGDEIRISRWFSGMALHPNRSIMAIGGTMAVIGGFFVFTFLLTGWSMKRQREREKKR